MRGWKRRWTTRRTRWTYSSTRASSTSPATTSRCRPGGVADTVDEAVAQADAAGYPVVVKAQVQVGGRGKAGGIKLANDADEARLHAAEHLGDGHQGSRRQARLGRASQRHRRGVLRVVHARPRREEAPADAVVGGRRRDRGGRGIESRRHRHAPHQPRRRAVAGGRAPGVRRRAT